MALAGWAGGARGRDEPWLVLRGVFATGVAAAGEIYAVIYHFILPFGSCCAGEEISCRNLSVSGGRGTSSGEEHHLARSLKMYK